MRERVVDGCEFVLYNPVVVSERTPMTSVIYPRGVAAGAEGMRVR